MQHVMLFHVSCSKTWKIMDISFTFLAHGTSLDGNGLFTTFLQSEISQKLRYVLRIKDIK